MSLRPLGHPMSDGFPQAVGVYDIGQAGTDLLSHHAQMGSPALSIVADVDRATRRFTLVELAGSKWSPANA